MKARVQDRLTHAQLIALEGEGNYEWMSLFESDMLVGEKASGM